MSIPESLIKSILKYEGSVYTNDVNDPGGPTKYGWTLKSYRNIYPNATDDDIKNLTESEAIELYNKYWWEKYGCQYILSKKLSSSLFLAQINLGYFRPNKLIQELCNEFGDYNLIIDASLGPKSIEAINNCLPIECAFPYILFHDLYMPLVKNGLSYYKKGWRKRVLSDENIL